MNITTALRTLALIVSVGVLVAPLAGRDRRPAGPVVRTDKPGEAMAFRSLSLRDENGAIARDGLIRARRHVAAMKAARDARKGRDLEPLVPTATEGTLDTSGAAESAGPGLGRSGWTWIGPGNVGGRVRALVIHPTSTQTMFAGSVGGGIWKTTDGGASWAPVDDFMANLAVTSMVIHPTNPQVMYAATGEGFSNADAIRGAGIFRSSDGGTTWSQLASTASASFYYVLRLAISPDGRTLLAGTVGGLHRSVDGGTTWTRVSGVPAIYDVDFQPGDSRRAVAGDRSGRVWYTTDAGLTWSPALLVLPDGYGGSGRVETAYAKGSPHIVYAVVDRGAGLVYRSSDGGATFSEVFRSGYVELLENGQGWYDLALWVNPRNANDLIVGGINLYRSRDGGSSFTQVSNTWGDLHADQHVIVEHPGFNNSTNRVLFIGNDGGVYKAPDLATLTSMYDARYVPLNNSLGVTQFYGAAGNPLTGVIVGGTQDNGTLVYRPESGSEGWQPMFGGDGGFSAADPGDPSYFYGEYIYLQLHRSIDAGASAGFIFSGISDAGRRANFIAPFVLDPNRPRRMLAGGQSLWRSNDAKAATPLWHAIKPPASSYISAIAVAPGNANLIWVGHNNGDLYRTANGTTTTPAWTKVDPTSFPNRYLTRITVDPSNHNLVYVAFGGFTDGNIQRTEDGGATWQDATGAGATGLPFAPVRDVEVDPSGTGAIWAGTEVGIFMSADRGATWDLTHDGPANVSVDELFVLNDDLYAVTHGRGLFRHPLGTAAAPEPPAPGVPAPWSTADVGAVGAAGSASYANGTFTVRGAGADVWGTADAFRYVYQALAGDGQIVARVASVEALADWVKAGVMIRQNLTPGSPHAFMIVSAGKGLAFQRRTAAGGVTTHTSGGSGTAPMWVRLARRGSVVTASVSPDGASWRTVGQDTIGLSGTVLVGLAVNGRSTTRTAAAAFDGVAVSATAASSLPSGWQSRDIGAAGTAGRASEAGGTFTVTGAGADIWGAADAFHYAYRSLSGDGTITARVATMENTHAWTKMGVMIRAGTGASAAHAMMIVSSGKGLAFQRRTSDGALSTHTSGGAGTAPRWVRVSRAGNVVTASVSTDGVRWTVVGRDTIALPSTALVGLVAHSHDVSVAATATFDAVSVSAGAAAAPE